MNTIPIFDKRFMEGILQSESRLARPENLGCAYELTRSNLDAFALTAEICECNTLRRSANATLDDCIPWTNDKHNLYLNHLEMSFVKQLHQSMGLLVQCSQQNAMDKNISQKHPANDHTASQQFTVLKYGYCQKIDNERDKPCSHSYADSDNPLMSPSIDNFRCAGMHWWLPSADTQAFLKLPCVKKRRNGKWIASCRLATCPDKFSASNLYEEGMGQNFVNEDNSSRSKCKSQAKRLKIAVTDSSGYDQIIPSRRCRKVDSAFNNISTQSGEDLS